MGERFWVVRVPKGQEVIQKVQKEGIVAVGFAITQSVADITDREEFKTLYRSVRPDATEPRVKTAAGQLYRLARVIEEADWILTPAREARKVLFGRVIGGYVFIPDVLGPGFSHARKVKWEGEFSRDAMSTDLRNSMSALSTIQNIDKHAVELLQLMRQPQLARPIVVPSGREEDEPVSFYEETRAKADELISDLISGIDPYDFQQLVAGLLEAMGYRTRTSERGPDQGVDIIAHPDPLGFEIPRIKVQVKHRQSAAGGPEIRNLVGTLGEGEKGLFVSTGGFTIEAKNEGRRTTRLTLVDGEEFVNLLTEHYEKLDPDYKAIVPLRKIWVPFSQR
jgi:restriction system protein